MTTYFHTIVFSIVVLVALDHFYLRGRYLRRHIHGEWDLVLYLLCSTYHIFFMLDNTKNVPNDATYVQWMMYVGIVWFFELLAIVVQFYWTVATLHTLHYIASWVCCCCYSSKKKNKKRLRRR